MPVRRSAASRAATTSVRVRFHGLGTDGSQAMSLFDVSLETANSLYKWGWRGSIFGAVITALAVASLMWGTRVRDRDFEARMTELNVVAGQARERASAADERAAALEKQAAQLRLDLEKERAFREPRTLTQTQQNSVAAKIRAFAGTGFVMYVQLAPEPIDFLLQLEAILRTAKWLPHPPS